MDINRMNDFPGHFSQTMPQNGRFLGVIPVGIFTYIYHKFQPMWIHARHRDTDLSLCESGRPANK